MAICNSAGNPNNTSSPVGAISPISTPCYPNRTIVEFRPHLKWKGEFGFDWLRVDDTPVDHQPVDNKTYEESIVASKRSGFDKKDLAYGDLEDEEYVYLLLKNTAKNSKSTAFKYHIPYLNLYSKKASEEISEDYKRKTGIDLTYKPPCKATLRLISFTEGNTKPTKVFIKFSKEHFVINTNKTGKLEIPLNNNFIPSEPGKRANVIKGGENYDLEIKCIEDLDKDYDIEVYTIYTINGKEKEELAGCLTVCQNDVAVRKTVNILKINVKTAIEIIEERSEARREHLDKEEMKIAYNVLYQALIYPNFEEIEFNNTKDHKFYSPKESSDSFIMHNSLGWIDGTKLEPGEVSRHLREVFMKDPIYGNQYDLKNTAFLFFLQLGGLEIINGTYQPVGGYSESIGKSVVLYVTRSLPVTAHELLHTLGLHHTFDEGYRAIYRGSVKLGNSTVSSLVKKETIPDDVWYVYEPKSTTNIMDYHKQNTFDPDTQSPDKYEADELSTWHWQWDIMRGKL